jgi:hypothetical protein
LTADEKQMLSPFLPEADVENAVIHFGETPRVGIVRFPMPKNADGVTVNNNIYLRKSTLGLPRIKFLGLLAHELFHVDQYRTGTMTVSAYLTEVVKGHGTEEGNKFEEPAYRFGLAVEQHLSSTGKAWDGSLIP